ncbi:MAG: UvrD-helicase domain-containing protein [Synergistaceae bacterium]|nr:UvrD-helicase domain-containing protein [Synergistaceae bacterium]
MNFLIADTFTDSLTRLSNDEQKQVKITVFDLQTKSDSPGLSFHRLDRARDKNFWSVRVSGDLRIIVHKTDESLLVCYAGHHDNAYEWAERRKFSVHPVTGAAQIVEIREKIEEIVVPKYIEAEIPLTDKAQGKLLFSNISDETLLGYGVPEEWLSDVRHADEDYLLSLNDHLPSEAMEALLEVACGNFPLLHKLPEVDKNRPFEHPDAKRRFRIISNKEELARAMDLPWEKWIVFLHPDQSEIITKNYSGPARVSGSAGTGKTVVALHRAVWLARSNPDVRILLTTFTDVLANSLMHKRNQLLLQERNAKLSERIDVLSLEAVAARLYRARIGDAKMISKEEARSLIDSASAEAPDHKFGKRFLYSEWDEIVDAYQIKDWDGYRDVARLGRKTRLPEKVRKLLWAIYAQVIEDINFRGALTLSSLFSRLAEYFAEAGNRPFDHIVVDEAQDISVQQLKFLSSLAGKSENALFFAGDLGQRIFQQPFSWKSLGVDVRGRSKTLRVNYRTSHQIRTYADRLLDPSISDLDGNIERRDDAISVFNGPEPKIILYEDEKSEQESVAQWINKYLSGGVKPNEISIFVRSESEIPRAIQAVKLTHAPFVILDQRVETKSDNVSIGAMRLAKGLEFKAVAVMACDEDILPLASRIAAIGDDSDLKEVYDTERHLFYVACTRAREDLLITGVKPGSEFIEDM